MGNSNVCRGSETRFDLSAPMKLDRTRTKGARKIESKSESSSSRRSCDAMAWAADREFPLPYGVDVNGCGFSIDLGSPNLFGGFVEESPSLEGDWFYNGPGRGKHKFQLVIEDEDHMIFREYHDEVDEFAEGTLKLDDAWWVGDLKVGGVCFGTVRLQLDDRGNLVEQFKKKPYHEWGKSHYAVKETKTKQIGRKDLEIFQKDVWSHVLTGELLSAITSALGKQKTMYCHHFSSHQYAIAREGDSTTVHGVTAAEAGDETFKSTREVWNFLRKPRCCGVLAYDSLRGRMVCGPCVPKCFATACDKTTCLFIKNGLPCPAPEWACT